MTGQKNRKHNTAASVRARLLNKARAERLDFNLLLTRYALERILYRLSVSSQRRQFLLKGALLFDIWFDMMHRPTHDADLLGFGSAETLRLERLFREVSQIVVEDGIVFRAESVKADEIRKDAGYAGVRVTMLGLLDGARCPVRIDIGFGDAVTPAPENIRYPVMLDGIPQPQLRAYPRYTVIAEKLEAMIKFGMINTRMKDYFDLWILARYSEFDGGLLTKAIHSTFERRGTKIPLGTPLALSNEFAKDLQKNSQWNGFQRKNALEPVTLTIVVDTLRNFLLPVLAAQTAEEPFEQHWHPDTAWRTP